MKIKKLSLLFSLGFIPAILSLSSCDNKKTITYTQDNGEEKIVEVKKTNNKEEISDAIMAIVYSKNEFQNPTSIGLLTKADIKLTGTQVTNNKSFSYAANESSKVIFSFGDNLKAYADIKLQAKLPIDMLYNDYIKGRKSIYEDIEINEDGSVKDNSETTTTSDYTKVEEIAIKADAYLEDNSIYATISNLILPYETLGLSSVKEVIETFVGDTYKIDENSVTNYLKSFTSSIMGDNLLDEYVDDDILDSYNGNYDNIFDSYSDITLDEVIQKKYATQVEFKEALDKIIEDNNIVISSIDGNNITLKLFAKNENPKEDEFKGNSYLAFTFDMQRKLPIKFAVDFDELLTYQYNQSASNAQVKNLTYKSFDMEAIFQYNAVVPTLSEEKKENAKTFNPMSLPTKFVIKQ